MEGFYSCRNPIRNLISLLTPIDTCATYWRFTFGGLGAVRTPAEKIVSTQGRTVDSKLVLSFLIPGQFWREGNASLLDLQGRLFEKESLYG